jgi:hypothetical protein
MKEPVLDYARHVVQARARRRICDLSKAAVKM